jgi:hypothetical protein
VLENLVKCRPGQFYGMNETMINRHLFDISHISYCKRRQGGSKG